MAPPFTPPPPLEAEQVEVEISNLQASEQDSSEEGFSQFVSRIFMVTKKDSSYRPSGEFETIEPVCAKETFQDGEYSNAPVSAQEGRLDDHH